MKTLKIYHLFIAFILFFLLNDELYSQPIGYPPETPDPISICQKDVICGLGSSLASIKDAVGLLYLKNNGFSSFKGTVSIVRPASESSGVLMTAGHVFSTPTLDNWIRYSYKTSTCGGSNPTSVARWVPFQNNYQNQVADRDMLLIDLRSVDHDLYYYSILPRLGWSLLDQTGQSAKSIGHPRGNAMKATTYSSISPTVHSFSNVKNVDVWAMTLNGGYVEIGQSGSPAIVNNTYFIGTLLGDTSLICQSNPTGTVFAQRLSKYYRSFSEFLDPNHTGAVQVPARLNNGVEIGEYKYPSLSKSTNTVCSGETATVSINNFCEFMDGNVLWTVSNEFIVDTTESSDQKTLTIVPSSSGATGPLTVTARIDFGGWYKSYSTTLQIGKINSNQIIINGPYTACPNDYLYISSNYLEGVSDYDWDWGSGFQYFGGQGTRYLDLKASYNFNGGEVLLYVENLCGWTQTPKVKYINKGYSCGYYYSMSPIPTTTSEVTIEAVPDKTLLAAEPDFSIEFDVAIYDSDNFKVKEVKKAKNIIKINTVGLKKGKVYIVNITDKYKTESIKLIVD